MSPTRFAWIVAIILPLCCRVSVAAQEPAKPPTAEKTEPAADKPKPTPAEELLDKAIENLGKLEWMDTKFLQEAFSPGVKSQAKGRYVFSPKEQKVSFEYDVSVADARGYARMLSDGQQIWRVEKFSNKTPVVMRYDLAALQEARNNIDRSQLEPAKVDQLLRDIDEDHGFTGVQPLLQDLRRHLHFEHLESVTFGNNQPAYLLQGTWTKTARDALLRQTLARHGMNVPESEFPNLIEKWTKRAEFPFMPRMVSIYLDRASLWPLAVEWQGPMRANGDNVPLVRISFSEASFTKPASGVVTDVFTLPEELKKTAQAIDAKAMVQSRRDRLAQQEQLIRDIQRQQPLDPATTPKRP